MPGQIVGKVKRLEQGAIMLDLRADFSVDEIAALMEAISDYCKQRGWADRHVAAAHARILEAKAEAARFMVPRNGR